MQPTNGGYTSGNFKYLYLKGKMDIQISNCHMMQQMATHLVTNKNIRSTLNNGALLLHYGIIFAKIHIKSTKL